MTEYCNPMNCPAYATGFCEYDFGTGEIMPHDSEQCPLIKDKEKMGVMY